VPGGTSFDAVIIGAGIVGAACAYYLVQAGLSVAVVERNGIVAGTTAEGEGNILISDKRPGPELDLALLSNRLWRELPEDIRSESELDAKGGLVVAYDVEDLQQLRYLASEQGEGGVHSQEVSSDEIHDYEPNLAPDLPGGVFYPGDLQVQPMRAAALLLRSATRGGALLLLRHHVTGLVVSNGRITGVDTSHRRLSTKIVVNAAGTASGDIAALAGLHLPIEPRRGFIVVTEALPRVIRHKVYGTDYVANVESGDAALQTSTVIVGTASGTVLIGASCERVGFDRRGGLDVVSILCRGALRLFPVLAEVRAIRYYCGFRPYCPDHLPAIGEDPRVP